MNSRRVPPKKRHNPDPLIEECPTFHNCNHYNICGVNLCLPKNVGVEVIKNFKHLIKVYMFTAAKPGKCLPDGITNGVYDLWYHDIEKMYYLTKNGYDEIVSSNFNDVVRISDEQFVFVYFKKYEVADTTIIIGNVNSDIIEKYEYMMLLGFKLSDDKMSLQYPGHPIYFKYNAAYQVYLLNGETSDGDFTISSSDFADINKQLCLLNVV